MDDDLPPKGQFAEALERVFRRAAPTGIVSVYLFGSQASGRAHRQSDVDLAVLLRWEHYPAQRERFEERVRLSSDLGAALGRNDIDVVILNDAPPHLGARIVTAGRRVFCAAPEADHAFRRDVQLRAADLTPFLRRTSRVKLEAIRR
jgi:uncharacterized protein